MCRDTKNGNFMVYRKQNGNIIINSHHIPGMNEPSRTIIPKKETVIDLPIPLRLEDHPTWFEIERKEAEEILKNCRVGSYLFRPSTVEASIALSCVNNEQKVVHFKFLYTPYDDKKLIEFTSDAGKKFNFISDLIDNCIPLKYQNPIYNQRKVVNFQEMGIATRILFLNAERALKEQTCYWSPLKIDDINEKQSENEASKKVENESLDKGVVKKQISFMEKIKDVLRKRISSASS